MTRSGVAASAVPMPCLRTPHIHRRSPVYLFCWCISIPSYAAYIHVAFRYRRHSALLLRRIYGIVAGRVIQARFGTSIHIVHSFVHNETPIWASEGHENPSEGKLSVKSKVSYPQGDLPHVPITCPQEHRFDLRLLASSDCQFMHALRIHTRPTAKPPRRMRDGYARREKRLRPLSRRLGAIRPSASSVYAGHRSQRSLALLASLDSSPCLPPAQRAAGSVPTSRYAPGRRRAL